MLLKRVDKHLILIFDMDTIDSNYKTYKTLLIRAIGEEQANAIIASVGGDDAIKKASFGTTDMSGTAFEGSLVQVTIELMNKAIAINSMLPELLQVDKKVIGKISILSHIAKVIMFTPNDKQWEITNQGKLYKFAELEGALRLGERSLLIATNAGVQFTPTEFEAMRIVDKIGENDSMTKFFASPLSTVIKMANELVTLEHQKRF